MFERLRNILRARKTQLGRVRKTDLAEQYLEMPPHGQILVLTPAEAGLSPKVDAVAERLFKFDASQLDSTPFVGILIDLLGVNYRFSSSDLATVAAAIAAWKRGWVVPCSVALMGRPADELRRLLDITKLSELEQLQVVDSKELGLEHISEQLQKLAR